MARQRIGRGHEISGEGLGGSPLQPALTVSGPWRRLVGEPGTDRNENDEIDYGSRSHPSIGSPGRNAFVRSYPSGATGSGIEAALANGSAQVGAGDGKLHSKFTSRELATSALREIRSWDEGDGDELASDALWRL